MSQTTTAAHAGSRPSGPPPTFVDEKMLLVARIADDIAPGLADKPQDRFMAHQMAWGMVTAYGPTSEAEVLGAARVVSLSLTQLDLLRGLYAPDLTLAMKLRAVQGVVTLNRAITENERLLARRQRTEERMPARQRVTESPRGARSSGQDAAFEAMAAQAMDDFDVMRHFARQHPNPAADAAAHAPPDPLAGLPRDPAADPSGAPSHQAPPHPDSPHPDSPHPDHPAAESSAPPTPSGLPTPFADPVEAPRRSGPATVPPPGLDGAAEFMRQVTAARRTHHTGLPAAERPVTHRQPGAGAVPGGARAAGPG